MAHFCLERKALSSFLVMMFVISRVGAQVPQSDAVPGPFTAQQATAGLLAYQTHCASCHRTDLGGLNEAQPLTGADFMNVWAERTAQQLIEYTQLTMPLPPGIPGSLGEQNYVDIVAFLLQANGVQPGSEMLTATEQVFIGSIADGVMPETVRQATALASPTGRIVGGPLSRQVEAPSGLTGLKSLSIRLDKTAKQSRPYTVRLHFCEPEDVKPGQRTFDVRLSGKPVLEQFDVIATSGKRHKSIVREFKSVAAGTELTIDLVARKGTPILSGVEIVAED